MRTLFLILPFLIVGLVFLLCLFGIKKHNRTKQSRPPRGLDMSDIIAELRKDPPKRRNYDS